jgi:YebC/PmpR family DNA-binding regulatory protein
MAGHSHSANIAVRKGKQDAQRAKLFSKLSRYIIIAARNGGGDPTMNLRLRYAIDKARAVSMPRENIERAVKKGTGELAGETLDEISYEGYGPGGVAILVETMTDNRNRTNGEIRSIFEKGGGNMGTPGCVGYLFDRKGLFVVDAKKFPDEDAVMTVALEAEADDFRREGDVYEITCDPSKFPAVQEALQAAGIVPEEAEIRNLAKTLVDVDVETGKKVMRLIDNLDGNDDVQNVYTNANITEEMADV